MLKNLTKRRLFTNVVAAFPSATNAWRTWSGRQKKGGAEAGRTGGSVGGHEPEKRGHDLANRCFDLRNSTPENRAGGGFRPFLL